MPKASRETAAEAVDGPGFEGHYERLEGGYTVGFETFTEDVDLTPRLQGCRTTSASPRTGGTC